MHRTHEAAPLPAPGDAQHVAPTSLPPVEEAPTAEFAIINAPHRLTRRGTLLGMTTLAGAFWLAASPRHASAQEASGRAAFLAVSQQLTARQNLAAPLVDALHAAFRTNDAQFDAKVQRLATLMTSSGAASGGVQPLLAGPNADLATLPQSILMGFYLGVAGSGEKAICVAYASDLANQLVADVLHPPSYAYGVYGSWARKPA